MSCDGLDNDLDGDIDENSPDTDGDGQADCVDQDDDNDTYTDQEEIDSGSDPHNALSTPEECDGVDNDLDGSVDEGAPNTTGDGQANCVDEDDATTASRTSSRSRSDPIRSTRASTPEVCDGVDNDLTRASTRASRIATAMVLLTASTPR